MPNPCCSAAGAVYAFARLTCNIFDLATPSGKANHQGPECLAAGRQKSAVIIGIINAETSVTIADAASFDRTDVKQSELKKKARDKWKNTIWVQYFAGLSSYVPLGAAFASRRLQSQKRVAKYQKNWPLRKR